MSKITVGCDPELFLADVNGHLKAACGKIGGTKEKPQPLTALGIGYAVQEDNVAVEFNIPPAKNAREFVASIAKTMKLLNDGVHSGFGWHIINSSAESFPEEELQSPAARVFGCDPDFNAWLGGKKNPKPSADDPNLRSAGGHIHVGFDKGLVDGKRLIKCMDFCLGVPATLMDAKGAKRRVLYGKRGAYREKVYGYEYRTLSNFWVHNPKLSEWAFRNTERAFEYAISPFPVDEYDKEIEQAIDGNDQDAALFLTKKFNLEVVHV